MTLKLASTDGLLSEVGSVVDSLARAGVGAERAEGHARLARLIQGLVDGSLDLVLAPGNSGEVVDRPDLRVTVLRREEPRDVLIPAPGRPTTLTDLPPGSRVGIAGSRRRSFLMAHRNDLVAVPPWNGGGPDESLRSGAVDAMILGAVEARRLGLASRVTEGLDTKAWVPSAGEGCLVLLSRSDHPEGARWSGLDNAPSRTALFAERAALAALGADADGSVGILGMPHGRWIRLWGMVASGDGRHVIRGDVTAPAESPQAAGRSLADLLLARGAGPFIRETPQ